MLILLILLNSMERSSLMYSGERSQTYPLLLCIHKCLLQCKCATECSFGTLCSVSFERQSWNHSTSIICCWYVLNGNVTYSRVDF